MPPSNRADLTYCSPGQDANSSLLQKTRGFGVQLSDSSDLFSWANQSIVGAEYSDSDDTFAQLYQYGGLAPDRALVYLPSPFNNEKVISVSGTQCMIVTISVWPPRRAQPMNVASDAVVQPILPPMSPG